MKPNQKYLNQQKEFWAHVRSLSQELGYTERVVGKFPKGKRPKGKILVPSLDDVVKGLKDLGLATDHLLDPSGNATAEAQILLDYFKYRADVLNDTVEGLLMDADAAKKLYEVMKTELGVVVAEPMNKQSGEKKKIAYLTAIVNMLVAKHAQGYDANYNPLQLTTVTRDDKPVRTLARRVDGAFPSVVNPIAIWEIKEYYYTKTFGSRVADGVYETLLDGLELEELRSSTGIDVKHYLMVDSHFTWWQCGRSYLCRIIDMLHMGYVDEVLFGKELVDRLPVLVAEWVEEAKTRGIKPLATDMPIPIPLEDEEGGDDELLCDQ